MKCKYPLCFLVFLLFTVSLFGMGTAQAAYLIEIDTDGADDGSISFNSHFSFGGDTTTASQSEASTAYGLTGGDSIYGGDGGRFADTYTFTYDPSTDPDNLPISTDQPLGAGAVASGLTGGSQGLYSVYATWPYTDNVGNDNTNFYADTIGDWFDVTLSQNGLGDNWIKLGDIFWTSGAITLTQTAGENNFVSMRSAGVLFEKVAPVPVPTTILLLGTGLIGLAGIRRRFKK